MPNTPNVVHKNIQAALRDVKQGKPVIVVDDASRENEGDLFVAAEKITAQLVNFLAQQARGLICIALPPERLDALELPPMVVNNTDPYGTDFAVSVNARFGVSTGISAADRAQTIKVLIDPKTKPTDLVRPGHVFPLRAKAGGVLQRAGHTEAVVDLARLAGLAPAGVTCEIMNVDGTMARLPQLKQLAKKHHFKIVTIADLIAYRETMDRIVQQVAAAKIPTELGDWTISVFKSTVDNVEHVAIIKGEVRGKKNVLVRVHSECLTGDVFGSQRCDCGEQLHEAMRVIAEHGTGVILYLRQEGRGIGLVNKLHAYVLQDTGLDTVQANVKLGFPADMRDYGVGADILRKLGLSTIQILTNNPKKLIGLEAHGLHITKQIPLQIKPNKNNLGYLKTKKKKMGHLLGV